MGRNLLILICVVFAAGAVWMATRTGQAPSPSVRAPLQPTATETVLESPATPTAERKTSVPAPATPTPVPPGASIVETPVPEKPAEESEAAAVEPAAVEAPPEETPVLQYVIEDLSGNVRVEPFGGGPGMPVTEGSALSVGETLSVPSGGSAVLALNEQTNVQVGPDSRVTLAKFQGEPEGRFESLLKLIRGSLLSQVENLQLKRSSYEVESGGIVCGVRGTVFEVDNDGEQVQTVTHVGNVAVTSASLREEFVGAGKAFRFGRGRVLQRRTLTDMDRQRFKGWSNRRPRMIQKRRLRMEKFRQMRLERWKNMKQRRPGNVRPNPLKTGKPKAFLGRPAAQPGVAGSVNPAVNHREKPTLKQRIEEMKKLRAEKNAAVPPSKPLFMPKIAPTQAVAVQGGERKTGRSALLQKLKALKQPDSPGEKMQAAPVSLPGTNVKEWKKLRKGGILSLFPTATPAAK